MNKPNKIEREKFEIDNFICSYSEVKNKDYEIVKKLDDQKADSLPDYIVKDIDLDKQFYVELTTVYLDNKSFINRHWKDDKEIQEIDFNKDNICKYKKRVLDAIISKNKKAKKYPKEFDKLVLSIQLNEIEGIFINKNDWETFLKENETTLCKCINLNEVLLWNSGGKSVFYNFKN